MHFSIILFVLVCMCTIHTTLAVYQTQSQISLENSNLVIESAKDRNISIRLTGEGRFNVNDTDFLAIIHDIKTQWALDIPSSKQPLKDQINDLKTGVALIDQRIQQFENRTSGIYYRRLINIRRRLSLIAGRITVLERSLNKDDCESNPCQNGGTCIDLFNDLTCKCPANWRGTFCELDVDECYNYGGTDLGCQNNAACINTPGSYRCECINGWKGIHCSRREVDCFTGPPGEMCGNGICVSTNNDFGYTCLCDPGWKSNNVTPSCTLDVDECSESKHSCVAGCINLPGSFMCAPCPTGYSGDGVTCTDVNECEVNNGGCSTSPRVRCINTEGSYQCGSCPMGWSGNGKVCTKSNDCSNYGICHPQATCTFASNSVLCSCPFGMTGNGYGPHGCSPLSYAPCQPNPCKNGGECRIQGSSYVCICPPGYESNNCERRDPCRSSPCKNGGTCLATATSYRCLCSTEFSGINCEDNQVLCGTIRTQSSGTITYPKSGNYRANERCAWVIKTEPNKIFNITFSKFDLESHPDCIRDFLQIHNGRYATADLVGRFCGAALPKGGQFTSTHNQLYFWFQSNNRVQREGFTFSWESIDHFCGDRITVEKHGTVTSLGYPGKTPPNRDCEWILEAPPDKRIELIFYEINLSESINCEGDYLEILDGETERQELKKFCMSAAPAPVQSISNVVIVRLRTDNFNSDSSFQLHYNLVEGINLCGGYFTANEGHFGSPRVGAFGANNYTCKYQIHVHNTTVIQIDFPEFKLNIGDDCSIKSLEIFDGKTEAAPLVGRWCGNTVPENFTSSMSFLLVKYKFRGLFQNSVFGFQAHYKIGCGGTFRSSVGTILSPLFPKIIPMNLQCVYTIEAPENFAISLRATKFEIDDQWWFFSCTETGDNLAIYSPDARNSSLMGRYCKEFPEVVHSRTNRLVIVVKTTYVRLLKTFKLDYQMEDFGCGSFSNSSNGTINFNYNTRRNSENECEWILSGPPDHHIYLSFNNFTVGDCNTRFLRIQSEQLSDKHFGEFCGDKKPMSGVFPTNILTLAFHSSRLEPNEGFSLFYRFIDMHSECNAHYVTSSGTIFSPGWPGKYLPELNCKWYIHAPAGHQIQLNIQNFTTETCNYDYLEIRDGLFENSPIIGKYCERSIPKTILSYTNKLYLNFVTDDSIQLMGFSISWDTVSLRCGGTVTASKGFIIPPHYGDLQNAAAQCDWVIMVNHGSTINVEIVIPQSIELSDCDVPYLTIFDGDHALASKLTYNCTADMTRKVYSSGNTLFVRYKSANDVANSFHLTYVSNCRAELHDVRGIIESPNFPSIYPDNLNCEWTIVGRRGNKISMVFSHLALEEAYDKLQIYQILGDNELTKISDVTSPFTEVITTSGDTAIIKFKSDYSEGETGFRLEYEIKGCREHFTKSGGRISSPNSPYSTNLFCEWTITANHGQIIQLNVTEMLLEAPDKDCQKNALIVANDKDATTKLLERCQSTSTNLVVTSSGPTMYIQFYTDSTRGRKFINANYKILKSQCGGIYGTPSGHILSPDFPQMYRKGIVCEWLVTTDDHRTWEASLSKLDFPQTANCDNDYLEIYDGREKSPESRIVRLCGPILPSNNLFLTKDHEMLVVATFTNKSQTGFLFDLQYKKNCGKELVDRPDGFIEMEIGEKNCVWIIKSSDPNIHVTLSFVRIECECGRNSPSDCELKNGVEVFDGDSPSAPSKNSFCVHHPPSIVSNGQALTVMGKSGYFRAYYSLMENTCGGTLNSLRGRFASPQYPSSYPNNVECVWEIKAEQGNSIEISFITMNIAKSDHCNQDYLEIRERSSAGKLLGIFCGNELPSLVIGYEKMWIKFRSDEEGVGNGFLAAWNYAHEHEINGTGGIIKSPPILNLNLETQNYMWRITVLRGNVVLLKFEEYADGLRLFDGFDETAPQMEIEILDEITTTTNVAYIFSDNSILQPFSIRWQAVPKTSVMINETYTEDNSTCSTKIIVIPTNEVINISSPGYPHGYPPNLNCEWLLKTEDPTVHVLLKLYEVNLEQYVDCRVDYLSVYKSNDLDNWELIESYCQKTLGLWPFAYHHGNPYLKLTFNTDSSVNQTGFTTRATTHCGANLTQNEGVINGTVMEDRSGLSPENCTWEIKVDVGRRIKFQFLSMAIPSSNNICNGYVVIRDGFDEEAPLLGSGMFCSGKNLTIPETSTHRAFVKAFVTHERDIFWALSYRAVSDACGDVIHLSREKNSTNITTPNFPNIPNPRSECVWVVIGPPEESLEIKFVEQFDLHHSSKCDLECVEIRDGSTELSKLLQKSFFRPPKLTSSGNALYIKYFTNTPEPRNGFKAQISLTQCGGLFKGNAVQRIVTSKNYPAPGGYPSQTVCTYSIEVPTYRKIGIKFEDVHLPVAEDRNKSDHLTFYIPSDEEDGPPNEITSIYGDNAPQSLVLDSNVALIKFSTYQSNVEYRGFRFSYSSYPSTFGRSYTQDTGEINVRKPSSQIRSTWIISVPKGRKITLNMVEYSILNGSVSLSIYNDANLRSRIALITDLSEMKSINSTDNYMNIFLRVMTKGSLQRLKMNYTSFEKSECPPDLTERNGTFILPKITGNSFCRSKISLNKTQTLGLYVEDFNYLTTEVFRLALRPFIIREGMRTLQVFRENVTNQSFGIKGNNPYLEILQTTATKINNLAMIYKINDCGEDILLDHDVVISMPNFTESGRTDCAWSLRGKGSIGYDVTIQSNLAGDCDSEYISIYKDSRMSDFRVKQLCKIDNETIDHYRGVYIYYHTEGPNPDSRMTITATRKHRCGGDITIGFWGYQLPFEKRDYKNNLECMWNFKITPGYKFEIFFIDRFNIEYSNNCTKDYVEVRAHDNSSAINRRRFCGREAPAPFNITGNSGEIIFRSDNATTGDGFTIKFKVHCGGVYLVTEVQQKLMNHMLVHQKCNFTFIPSSNGLIQLTIQGHPWNVFHTSSMKCTEPHLIIYKEEMLEPENYCFTPYTKKEILGHSKITVTSNLKPLHWMGLQIRFKLEKCGGIVTNSTVIHSLRHQSDEDAYAENMECLWNVTAPAGSGIIIDFKEFDFHGLFECSSDYVAIYRGTEINEDKQEARLCGKFEQKNPIVKIMSNQAIIVAKSDAYMSKGRGFNGTVKFTKLCDETILLTDNNSSYNLNRFGNGYDNDLDCHYIFQASSGYFFKINFGPLNFSQCSSDKDCSCDHIEIRNTDDTHEVLHTFCKNETPPTVVSVNREFLMRFVTDSSGTAQGFNATVSLLPSLCGKDEIQLEGQEVVIESPNFGHQYPPNTVCRWTVKSNKSIEVHLEEFSLEEPDSVTGQCQDYLQISYQSIFGWRTTKREKQILCGNRTSQNYVYDFMGDKLEISFKSNGEIERRGFKISLRQSHYCNVTYTALNGRISKRIDATQCNLHFKMPEQYTLSFYFGHYFTIGDNCTENYIKFYNENTGELMETVCSYVKGVFMNTNRVRMEVSLIYMNIIDMTYLASRNGLGCGGQLHNIHGSFTSPLYPRTEGNYTNCRWDLLLPQGHNILLKFSDFDLGTRATCSYNYLKIVEISSVGVETETRKFCGEDHPLRYTSQGNNLAIIYNKNVPLMTMGTGWSVEYSSNKDFILMY